MNIDITPIVSGTGISVEFDMPVSFREEDINNTSIKRMETCKVKGVVTKVEENLFSLKFSLLGTMILEDAVTLEEIPYKFKIEDENDYEIGNYLKINDNLLDIYEVLWENVVLEVPLRVVKDNTQKQIEGNGWSLNKKSESNSGLSELRKLLEEEEK